MEKAVHLITTARCPSLEDAVEIAVEELTGLLISRLGLSRTEAFLLVSARGDVRIGQCARIRGLDATAYAVFPKILDGV
jgi:acetamidase/formamidase